MTTPVWQAPLNGLPGNQRANLGSAHLNQLFGAHAITQIGYGKAVVTPIAGQQGYFTHVTEHSTSNLAKTDFAQAFTMSGTTIGRITVPIKAFGNGADLLLSLCPDASGNPNLGAPICQVKVPASVITATGAENGLENATNPFQTSAFNTQFGTNYSQLVPWISPAATLNGAPSYFSVATSGNYSLLLGGYDTTAATASAVCFTVQYTGGGTVAPPVPQPSLPQATWAGHAAATSDTVMFAGGINNAGATVANVWTASWNPNTGAIGAWSAQAALPQAVNNGASASWGENVYVIGGHTTSAYTSAVNTVYTAKITNSQLGTWSAATPLPRALALTFVGVIGNWMIVAGGVDATNTYRAESYYAAILPDGTLGPWRNGPTMPQAVSALTSNWTTAVTTSSLIVYAGISTPSTNGNYLMQLSVGPAGPAPSWNSMTANAPGQVAMSAFTDGNGQWYLMGYNLNNTAAQNYFQAVPLVSAPLYATGLTNSAQYWVVAQELQSGSASDYLGIGVNSGAYSVDAKTSPRHQNTWSTYFGGWSVPLTVYDATLSQPIVHTVEDLSSGVQSAFYERWSTLTYNNLRLLAGAIEVTMQPNTPLNANPTFTSGVTPWTAANGTVTQSSAQVHGGYAFSGLLTPTGGFTQAYALSELIPVTQTPYGAAEWLLPTGWFYTPTTWSAFDLSVFWFDSSGAFISSSDLTTTLTGATWTQVSNYVQPPATAAQARVLPILNGSPTSAQLLYMSNVQLLLAPESVGAMTSAATVNYGTNPWPPTGVTQLN